MHGNNVDVPNRPDWIIALNATDEKLVSVFGTANAISITSIGFTTSKGRAFGPFGTGDGAPFRVDGQVLGFFGALNNNGDISGIGVWYAPAVAPILPASLTMSPAYGNLVNVWTWDDTPNLGGTALGESFL
jgi:hypothetical protein